MTRLPALVLVAVCSATTLGIGCGLFDHGPGHRGGSEQRDRVELNTASRRQLADLPGLKPKDADAIIANRPYKTRRGLVRKQVLTDAQFDAVRDHVYVEHESDD